MKETVSYGVKIVNSHSSLDSTMDIFRHAVSRIVGVVSDDWDDISHSNSLDEKTSVEKLIHSTRENEAKYKFFDKEFYKLPSYFRRCAQAAAIETVKAFKNATTEKKTLCRHPRKFPCMYRGEQFNLIDGSHCEMKIFNGHDWIWETFQLRKSDMDYIHRKGFDLQDATAPVLKKCGKGYKLVFAFKVECNLPEKIRRVCAVDLGINNDAVCSLILEDGTVEARKFINFADDKDQLHRILGNISNRQKLGSRKNRKLWRFANNANERLSINVARAIVDFASEQSCDCIVFEHLDTQGKKKGSRKQRLALWRKAEIQHKAEGMAHRREMRVTRVFAGGTSKYAFDGSGETIRSKENFSLCEFQTGKKYNCDLSASYNIGARYFIRAAQKTMSKSKWQSMVAKVPSLGSRTTCTLSTLLTLCAVM